MAFQIKSFSAITASCINWMKQTSVRVTDFSVGSVVRTMLEAFATELEELYMRMMIGLKEAIPVSVYTSFSFERLESLAASGTIRFSASGPVAANLIIQANTAVRIPSGSVIYTTNAEYVIPTGQSYVDAQVTAQTVGVVGNVNADTITELVAPIAGVQSVTNPNAFTNGRDEETDDERKTRFQGYITTLARGTGEALIYGAKTAKLVNADGLITEYVAHASVVEPYLTDEDEPVAWVNVYVYSGASVTSPTLVAETQKIIDGYYDVSGAAVPGWKAAGVIVDVIAATTKSINITGVVTVDSGYDDDDVRAAVEAAMTVYIQGLSVGETVILAELIAIAKRDIPGVLNINLTVPSGDVTCLISEKAVAGTITLT